MSSAQLRVVFASWPEEDFLVAEIWAEDIYVGHVRRNSDDQLMVVLHRSGESLGELFLGELEGVFGVIRERLGHP